ncbi:hypothetical protein VULLAG_LOCUS19629 [Vulpes lagopus]
MFWVPLVVAVMDQARMLHQRTCMEVEGYHEVRSWNNQKMEDHKGNKWSRMRTTDKPRMAELYFMLLSKYHALP